jgi:hypothetical protein
MFGRCDMWFCFRIVKILLKIMPMQDLKNSVERRGTRCTHNLC